MLFDKLQIEALKSQLVQKHSQQSYVEKAVTNIAHMLLAGGPDTWKHFGPYWPVVARLLQQYRPDMAQRVSEWGTPPDFLAHYDYGDEMLNCIAALQYLNRDGEFLAPVGHPHSIEMPDGSTVLYSPGKGLLNHEL
jgi:hypothetical protein